MEERIAKLEKKVAVLTRRNNILWDFIETFIEINNNWQNIFDDITGKRAVEDI